MRVGYNERLEIYDKVYAFMINCGNQWLPTPIEHICQKLGIEIVPLSDIVSTGYMTAKEIFEVWGNESGAVMSQRSTSGVLRFKIAYNNSPAHIQRKNFTITEELAHIILGHYKSDTYSIYNLTHRNDMIYYRDDESARIAAGIILCPPPFFYEVSAFFNISDIMRFCNVSQPCAQTRFDIMKKYRREFKSRPLYEVLSQRYERFIASIACVNCGGGSIVREYGACPQCLYDMYDYGHSFSY